MSKALIIVDVQNDYFPNGRYELSKPLQALENIKKLVRYFNDKNYSIFHIQHIAPKGATFFEEGTCGADIHNDLLPAKNVIIKHAPNSFLDTNLDKELKDKGIKEIVICGMMTHICIDATAKAGDDLGYKVTVISDACDTRDLEWNGEKLPSHLVEKVFFASLSFKASVIKTTSDFINS